MAERKGGLTDPVAEITVMGKDADEMNSLDINKAPTFKPIPIDTAKARKPFEGYPLKKVKFGQVNTYETFIVALNPSIQVIQDQANRKVKQKDKTMQKVHNWHSRVIRDRELNENVHIPFDRLITIKGTIYSCAIVASHNVRAQICFAYDAQRQRVIVDTRYMLLDVEQRNRLRQVYEQVINPKIKMEREAAYITGESNEETGGAELVAE